MSGVPRLFDSHAHLDDFEADGTLSAMLERAREAGVQRILAVGGTPQSNLRAVQIARRHPDLVRATVGFDRDEAESQPDWTAAEDLMKDPLVAAVGETGLDYHYSPDTAPRQRDLFEANLQRARDRRLPVVVHTRDADDDTVGLLANHVRSWTGEAGRVGVIHCFTGSDALARRVLDLGFLISFSGIVTFKNAEALRAVARLVPSDRLLIETDAPFLAPVPYRGKRNEPCWVREVAVALASARNDTLQGLAEQAWWNATRLFGWKD